MERILPPLSGRSAPAVAGQEQSALALRPIRVEKTFRSVANEIKRLIFSGALKPGDRLPSEFQLVEQLRVSRSSVREALRELELSGLLKVQRGGAGGRVVVDTIAASIGDSLLDVVRLTNVSTEELTAARIEMETLLVRHAVAHADEGDLSALRQSIANAHREIAAGAPAIDDNMEFHNLISRAAKNSVLAILQEALTLMFRRAMARLSMVPTAQKSVAFTEAHEEILEAIEARDAELAEARMKAHLIDLTSRLLQEP